MWLSTLIWYPWAYSITLTQLYSPCLAQILRLWVTCGVKMMRLCHGWGWQSPQTASHIHIRHAQSIWAHWYAVHRHMVAALHSFTHPTWLRFWGSGSLVESKQCDYVMVEAESHLKLLPTSILDMCKVLKCLSILICCPHAYSISLTKLYPLYFLAPILGFWVTCGVKMMWLCHGWGWQPPQTASHIHIRHIKSDWAHWYAIHGHEVSALHSYTHTTWVRFRGSGSFVASKWCDYVSYIHIRHIQSIWAHWYAVHWHTVAALQSFTYPTWLRFWGTWSLVESKWCIFVMVDADSHLKLLLPTSILDTYKVMSTLIWHPWAYSISFTQLYPPCLAQILGFWATCGVKMMRLCHGWGWQPPQTASHIHIRHAQSIWAHWYAIHRHMVAALHSFTHPTWCRFLGSGSLAESK